MSTIQWRTRSPRWWTSLLGLAAVALSSMVCWSMFKVAPAEDAPGVASSEAVTAQGQTSPLQAPTVEALSVAEKVVAAAIEGQKEAAQVVERHPDELTPIVGKVKERPPYVSAMEWSMLMGVAEQHDQPDQALTRLVNHLRFTKKLELYQGLSPAHAPARRMALAEQLIQELPTRLSLGEMDASEARRLLAELLDAAVPDADARQRRSVAEQAMWAKVMATTPP